MYRTDKQFMTNSATAPSRIYIGGLPKTIVASDLEEKFRNHGNILGLVLQMGFAFIQFETDTQAQTAIRCENNCMLHGKKISVRQALDKSQKGPINQNRRPQQNFQGNYQQQQQFQPHSQQQQFQPSQQQFPPPQQQFQPPPQQQRQRQFEPPPQQQQQNQGPPSTPQVNEQKPPQVEPPKPPLEAEKEQNAPPPPLNTKNSEELPVSDGPPEKRPRKRRVRSRDRYQPAHDMYRDEPYYGRDDYAPPFSHGRPPVIDQPDRNDCEIIVVSKALTKYAEYIEQRLKALGLIVDLLFPNEDVPIGRVLANISSRGCLYAILVMPQNEEHRSLTLNVLHGMPQEHRNIPIEDALILMMRNFDVYMRGDKSVTETLGPGGVVSLSDRHPTSMQLLLNLLAENRQITSMQFDKLVKYLQDRRELQHQYEVDEGVDQESQESSSKQAELQSRIMNILNKSADNPPPPPPPPQTEASPAGNNEVAPPLLKDPSVQKALDSLLGGDMFKNITAAL